VSPPRQRICEQADTPHPLPSTLASNLPPTTASPLVIDGAITTPRPLTSTAIWLVAPKFRPPGAQDSRAGF